MASVGIVKGDELVAKLKRLQDLLKDSTDETRSMLNTLEQHGTDISEGLASFPPKLKELLAPMAEMEETLGQHIKTVRDLNARFEELNKLKDATLGV